MKKTLKAHDERNVKQKDSSSAPEGALPTYLLDREGQKDAKALSTAIKEKRKDKAAKYAVPLPKVRGIAEDEAFKVMRTGKSKKKAWKRMVTKATFVGEGFTRKPVKMERFIRPMALRYKKANVTHRMSSLMVRESLLSPTFTADLKATFQLQILGVKKNPQSPMYTQLGVLTKGTIIEVNVSELGMVTAGGKVVFGKYAQITNNPENDGCINAVLRMSFFHFLVHILTTIDPSCITITLHHISGLPQSHYSRSSVACCLLCILYHVPLSWLSPHIYVGVYHRRNSLYPTHALKLSEGLLVVFHYNHPGVVSPR